MEALFTFSGAHAAIRAEQVLLALAIPARVMPVPPDVSAGCGIALRIPCSRREDAASALAHEGAAPQGVYLRDERDGRSRPFPLPLFSGALGVGPGDVVGIVGCGGKTALLHRLAMENRDKAVLMAATTKILPPPGDAFDHMPERPKDVRPGVNLIFGGREGEKLCGLPPGGIAAWLPAGGVALVEADGSRGLPLKGWAEYEPVVPPGTTVTVGVCTLWPLGRACGGDIAHRLELFCRLAGIAPGEAVALEHIAAMAARPNGMFARAQGRRLLLINQVESPQEERLARRLAGLLHGEGEPIRCFMGSLHKGRVAAITGEDAL